MIWNPFPYGPTGAPVGAVAPPALRVYGQATAAQLAAAQAAFAVFCGSIRGAPGRNPSQIGRLPDGTPFRITVVGPVSTMEIWPASTDDDRFSGIAVTIEHVDGSVIPGHHTDGVRTQYLLTPQVRKGTRISTGKWKVRKPKSLSGGKAVHAVTGGRIYYTGIVGAEDLDVPLIRQGGTGVNGIAYDDDLPGVDTPLYRGSSKVAVSRDNPIPWVYRKNGVSLGMQLQIHPAVGPTPYRLDLYVGPIAPPGADYVGVLVNSFDLPTGITIRTDSISISADGSTGRAVGFSSGDVSMVRMDFSPTTVSAAVVSTAGQSRLSGFRYNNTFRNQESGTPATVGYTAETWRVFGDGSSSTAFDSVEPVDTSISGPVSMRTTQYLGELDFITYRADSFYFDRRGLPNDTSVALPFGHASGKSEDYTRFKILSESTPGVFTTEFVQTTLSRGINTMTSPAGSVTVFETSDQLNLREETVNTSGGGSTTTRTVSGGGFENTDTGGGPSPIYEDKELDFSAAYLTRDVHRLAWSWIVDPGVSAGYRKDVTSDTVTLTREFRVVCRGVTHLSFVPDFTDFHRCVAFLASDPMTGALLVNIQEVHSVTRVPRRSWIFLVDDTGAKMLGDVLQNLPNSDNTKAVSNASIFSV